MDGSLECTFVGLKLGERDGFEEGPEVGEPVGDEEGNKEGFALGSKESVGFIERVGFEVGE